MISNSAPLWALWLAVTNVALGLWWRQGALPTEEMAFLIFGYLALFNGAALAVREWGTLHGVDWLAPRWTRVLLALVTLYALLVPAATMILASDTTISMLATGIVGLIGHVVLYAVYRHLLRDAWAVSATVLSGCLIPGRRGLQDLEQRIWRLYRSDVAGPRRRDLGHIRRRNGVPAFHRAGVEGRA